MWESGVLPVILIVILITWINVAKEKSVSEANSGVIGCALFAALFYFFFIDLASLVLCVFLG